MDSSTHPETSGLPLGNRRLQSTHQAKEEMRIKRRTFEAKKHPKGSAERKRLNGDALTSEYSPSYKYAMLYDYRDITRDIYKTKWEAQRMLPFIQG